MSSTISENSTHDLWVEARQFDITLTRPTPTTIQLTITRPTGLEVTDGALVLLSEGVISGKNFPTDHDRYVASLDRSAPADVIGDAQVVAFYSNILLQPLPAPAPVDGKITFTLTVTNTDPDVLYYASVHAASNVLQYYTLGVQSYPLESSRIEKDSATYTGSIPQLVAPPLNPAPGHVYYDTTLKVVQYWDGTFNAWIPTRADTIPSGNINPGVAGHAYSLVKEAVVKVFDGAKWVNASPANLQVRVGLAWAPITNKFSLQITDPEAPAVGDLYYSYTTQRIQYWDGTSWQPCTTTTTLFDTGSGLIPAFTVPFTIEPLDLVTPYRGLLFYNLKAKALNVWTGTEWIKANTDQEGTPSTDKVAIGTDGSYNERVRLIKVLQAQLGWPAVCSELSEEQFNIAIDNALDTYRQLSDGAYRLAYILFTVQANQQHYYLNSPIDKTDRIVTVNKIHRLNILGANSLSWDSNVYFQTFLNQYYSAGYVDLLSNQLLHMLSGEFNRLFAGDLPFLWDEASRELQILRRIVVNEKLLIEVEMERTEQELLLDRWCKQWLQGWAMAELKEVLGLIRSKYSSGTPGAGGNITLNGELLIAEARQDFTELRQQLFDYEAGGHTNHANVSFLFA